MKIDRNILARYVVDFVANEEILARYVVDFVANEEYSDACWRYYLFVKSNKVYIWRE
jgi:hypothetical protein